MTWLCPSTGYDHEAMAQAGSTMDGEKVFLTFLPFEEVESNKMLANFVNYTGKDKIDGFGVTRGNVLTELQNTHSFNSGGMIGTTDVGKKIVTPCSLMLEWNQGNYTRVNPKKQGPFDCTKANYTTVKATSSG